MNHIITTLFQTCIDPQDPQRKIQGRDPFTLDNRGLDRWVKSLGRLHAGSEVKVTIFHDLPEDPVGFKSAVPIHWMKTQDCGKRSPYDFRWECYLLYLTDYADHKDQVFMTDISDVLVLNDPFVGLEHHMSHANLEKSLFVNDQPGTLRENRWMRDRMGRHEKLPNLRTLMPMSGTVLNAGITGGKVVPLITLVHQILFGFVAVEETRVPGDTDMVVFNWACRTLELEDGFKIVSGMPVNTPFRSGLRAHPFAWFAHK